MRASPATTKPEEAVTCPVRVTTSELALPKVVLPRNWAAAVVTRPPVKIKVEPSYVKLAEPPTVSASDHVTT